MSARDEVREKVAEIVDNVSDDVMDHGPLTALQARRVADRILALLDEAPEGERVREPVLPVSEFCAAIRTWMDCIATKSRELEAAGHEPIPYAKYLERIDIDISKSNLLARLIYGREPLRHEKCPEHQGRWSGCHWEPCPHGCSSGSNITGWLPPEDTDGETR